MRAEIERHAEYLRIGDTAAANPTTRLIDPIALLAGSNAARGRDAGGAGADDGHVHVARILRRGERRRRNQCGGGGKKRAAAKPRHGIRILSERAVTVPEPASRGKFHG